MVRVPQWWRGAVTVPAQGLWTPGSSVAARRVEPVPLSAYRNRVDVDLGNDGIAPQATFQGYGASGSATSPTTFQIFVAQNTGTGTYVVSWTVTLGGTVGAADANNFQLSIGGTLLATSVNAGATGTYPQTAVTVTAPGGTGFANSLNIKTGGSAPTSGSVYSASFSSPGAALAQIGPSGWGESWALDQASLSTSVGALDPAQCTLFVGPLNIAFYQVVNGLAGGGSQFGLGGVGLSQGWFVWAQWTGGTAGAFAYLRLTGVKTALTQ